MSVSRVVVVLVLATAVEVAAEEVLVPSNTNVPAITPDIQSDFIVPIADDLRVGYSANFGSYHRSQSGGEGVDNHFAEHGLWMSYIRALSGPGRVLTGRTEWRAEIGALVSQADVSNTNDSTGTLRTASLDLGIGPAFGLLESENSRLEIEIMPFVGMGYSRYTNEYSTDFAGFRADTEVSASGFCLDYGIKANVMWCWSNGWGIALHAGVVQRRGKLEGDSATQWSNGDNFRNDYSSDDVLTGVRFGLFVAKRY